MGMCCSPVVIVGSTRAARRRLAVLSRFTLTAQAAAGLRASMESWPRAQGASCRCRPHHKENGWRAAMVRTLELVAVDPVAGRAAKCKRLVSQAVLFFLLHLMNATEAETLRARHGLARFSTPSFVKMCFTCDLTVSGVMARDRAICLLDSPCAINLRMSPSRALKDSTISDRGLC